MAKVTDPIVTEALSSKPLMQVQVLDIKAEMIDREIVVQGELMPNRTIEVRAQTTSKVAELPVEKGQRVDARQSIVELDAEDRHAQLKRAEAAVDHFKLEVAGARKLEQRGLQSENQLKSALASLAAAEADLKRARLELDYIQIKAPFSGILEQRFVELGSHLEKGDKVALILDESLLKAVGLVSQQAAGKLAAGQLIKVRLLDGQEAEGNITYISQLGDSETHSFRVEAEIDNKAGRLNAGVSAELRIVIGKELAHFISPAVLALNDSGTVGIKSVDQAGLIAFHPIEFVRTEANGIWVSGLPESVQVVSQGQGFVNAGETVIPVPAS
ncbi:MAG: efflux RND transporter periplasmic adaptor subunit [Candidatus Thiodiazotropha lotti]|nr:efflux RND transporter periplasmic adaptor subunit [Candidatus Thiodiazotropha lotti]MCG8005119.1 efflux RND transporter periplasmic adaptor subunit [Candidatus Thiodiazotropha lotti]MCW4188747.1 efflux RND transporter periplasmic adaptor subunit [Candidatus Thiodiazotropha lotti]MCW4199175.1 efflux RND transporter periplasmic adaptor subunit [Candidatus Thiodiazotropha lotti]